MLVCGCMEYDFWMVSFENLVHTEIVSDTCDEGHKVQRTSIFHDQFLLDIVGVVFVDIDNDNLFRIVLCYLSNKFTSDATATTGHHANFLFDICTNVLVVELDGVTTKQVFNFNVANLRCICC